MAEMAALPLGEVRTLLAAENGDAALVYLYLRTGGERNKVAQGVGMDADRAREALALLERLGLLPPPEPAPMTDAELLRHMEQDEAFRLLAGEVQRQLGRVLSTEDLRILAGLTTTLRMETDVVGLLVSDCIAQAKEAGRNPPNLRAIERAAYRWAERGVVTMELAAEYLQQQRAQRQILKSLALRFELGRSFRTPERNRVAAWLDLGFGEEEIYFAYERCLTATHDLKWAYMEKIIRSWHLQGLHTMSDIQAKDQRPAAAAVQNPKAPLTRSEPGELERRMLARLQAED